MNSLAYKDYTASMDYDPVDHILVGRLIGVRDRVVFHGESVDEFEAAFRDSVDAYLENCAVLGKEPEKPASGRLMLRIPPSVHCAALAAVRASGQSLNQWAASALQSAASQEVSLGSTRKP
ncbi:MAG: type II toxin-antitoxin system HicB family antitoxin [Candidatus Accumulibacter sp.]|jgi:predicted HicB family RNase H-like nuclease|nr:type II toxin-antitoxin system HicB family antitoxin [Accumulibacter sp.]